ncbi:MAG: hypothetical protein IT370_01710 [Deltaproteobacteria bacterium]|nr:hypothetical protein [Deltaproteobacteria bacterium]
MGLPHTALESPPAAVLKVLGGPAGVRAMAAKGLAPMPPRDLATCVYALSLDEDQSIAASARETAGRLPDQLLGGVLGDATLDPRVLDFFAMRALSRRALVELIIRNKATAHETIADIAGRTGDAGLCDLIAENETRLLAAPKIIASMYMNPKARMSTVNRAVELAARAGVKVDIPGWDDVVAEVTRGSSTDPGKLDAQFASAIEVGLSDEEKLAKQVAAASEQAAALTPDELPEDLVNAAEGKSEDGEDAKQRIQDLPIGAKMRLAMLGNAYARSVLVRDSNRLVAMAAVKSPRITDSEIITIAGQRSVSDDVIRYLANAKEWLRLYQVKVNLVFNPKCPLSTSMRLLPHMQNKQLKIISRSKAIPSALQTQAKKFLEQKKPGGA